MASPLSKTQYGIYVECVNHNGEICYNIPYLYTFDRSLDAERLARAVETAVKAHPTLFTRIFLNDEGEPMQTVEADDSFTVEVEDTNDIETLKKSLIKPFDIYGDRLFRVHLLRDPNHIYLYIEYHHIIADGTSTQLIFGDIEKAYQGLELEKEELTLAEAAELEAAERQTAAFEEAKAWYAQNFVDARRRSESDNSLKVRLRSTTPEEARYRLGAHRCLLQGKRRVQEHLLHLGVCFPAC